MRHVELKFNIGSFYEKESPLQMLLFSLYNRLMKKIYITSFILLVALLVGTFFLIRSSDEPTKEVSDSTSFSGTDSNVSAEKKKIGALNNAVSVKKSVDFKNRLSIQNKAKIVFKKPQKRFKVKKSLFPKGRIKNFPWRKGRPVLAKKFKPLKGKMPNKYKFQNEVSPKWESYFREKINREFEGQKINTDKKNSIIIANGDKAIFAEEVGVTVGENSNEIRMIVNSENGNVIHRFSGNETPSGSDSGTGSGSGGMRAPSSGGGGNSNNQNDDQSSNDLWGNYSGFHYAKEDDLKSIEAKKEDEQSLSPRIEMTQEEKEAYQKSLEN